MTADDPMRLPVDPALADARVQAVHQPDAATVVLETHSPGHGAARWLLSVAAEGARFGRTFRKAKRGGPPPVFCQWLRTRLLGARVAGLALPAPQLLRLSLEHGTGGYRLLLELNRRDSNLLLLDAADRLLIALRHPSLPDRSLSPGEPYRPPPRLHAWPRVPLAERYGAADAAAARELEQRWEAREEGAALEQRLQPARQLVRRELKRRQRRLEHLQADAAAAHEAGRWKRWGELLQIHRARLRPGLEALEVPDVFEPGEPVVTIPLQRGAEPGENIERCFRQFRKRRAAGPRVDERIAATHAELAAWQALAMRVESADTTAALAALATDLPPDTGALAALLRGDAPAAPATEGPREPMRRHSADGYAILIGRSAQENDRVTFRLAKGRDWWLHAQGIPGSHVVVLNPSGEALPPRTLREAAWLAGYYSQGRSAGKVEVDCTQRKHVRRIKGGEPGQVTFAHHHSLVVDLSDLALRGVLERTEPRPPAPQQKRGTRPGSP